jgi:tripartite ATP-independent transporter DctM subunit
MIWSLFIFFVVFILLGVPFWCSIVTSSALYLLAYTDVPLIAVSQNFFTSLDNYSLLAVPFFVLAGEIMTASGMTTRLVNLSGALVGHIRGGLGMMAICTSMLFAGISGSAIADTSAIGSVLLPWMRQRRYPMGLAVTLQACAGGIGVIIPPSILMIIYGSVTGISINRLFLGGIIPGVLIGVGLLFVTYLYSLKYPSMAGGKRATWEELVRSIREASFALLMPIIIIGGIVFGIFTATEAGLVAVLYGLFVGLVLERSLSLKQIPEVLERSAAVTGMIMLILGASSMFGWILARELFPIYVGRLFSYFQSPLVGMLVIVAALLVIGCFVEVVAALIMLTPIVHQVSTLMGLEPVHFALIFIVALTIGGITPPLGGLLFVSCGIGKTSLDEALPYIPAYVMTMVIVVLLMVFFPRIVLLLPDLFS